MTLIFTGCLGVYFFVPLLQMFVLSPKVENHFSHEKPSVYRATQSSINLLLSKLSVFLNQGFWSFSFPALRAKRIPIKIDIWIYYLSVDSSYNTLSLNNKTSNNASFGLFSVAQVNSILGWKLFKIDNMYSTDPVLRKVIV